MTSWLQLGFVAIGGAPVGMLGLAAASGGARAIRTAWPALLLGGFLLAVGLVVAIAAAGLSPTRSLAAFGSGVTAGVAVGGAAFVLGKFSLIWLRRVWAAIAGSVWVFPLGAATATAAVVLAESILPQAPGGPIGYGLVSGLFFWVLVGIIRSPWITTAQGANNRIYDQLKTAADNLRQQLAAISAHVATPEEQTACREAENHLRLVEDELSKPGFVWVTGTGYVTVLELYHRAEEALIGAMSKAALLEEVVRDELQLRGSTLPNRDHLIRFIDSVKTYLRAADHVVDASKDEARRFTDTTKDESSQSLPVTSVPDTRLVLREIRISINQFRDWNWYGLLRLRRHTMHALVLAEFAVLIVLAVAVVAGAPRLAVLGGVTCFLVGATIGLVHRLYTQMAADATVEDFGLSTVSLFSTSLSSGLAAVGGVAVIILLVSPPAVGLAELFNIQTRPLQLIVAAAFGLLPEFLVSRLVNAEQYKENIKSTAPVATLRAAFV